MRQAKAEGVNVTAEACPHHFCLTDEAILEHGTNAKMNPPLRTKEDVEEILEIDVSYLWDRHELMEEYLYPDDDVIQGIGLSIADGFGVQEEHFDGYLTELLGDPVEVTDSILTQHWRYDRTFGIVTNSWQLGPIEQAGQDGDHTGDNPWGA